jgi:hypothetical protein
MRISIPQSLRDYKRISISCAQMQANIDPFSAMQANTDHILATATRNSITSSQLQANTDHILATSNEHGSRAGQRRVTRNGAPRAVGCIGIRTPGPIQVSAASSASPHLTDQTATSGGFLCWLVYAHDFWVAVGPCFPCFW